MSSSSTRPSSSSGRAKPAGASASTANTANTSGNQTPIAAHPTARKVAKKCVEDIFLQSSSSISFAHLFTHILQHRIIPEMIESSLQLENYSLPEEEKKLKEKERDRIKKKELLKERQKEREKAAASKAQSRLKEFEKEKQKLFSKTGTNAPTQITTLSQQQQQQQQLQQQQQQQAQLNNRHPSQQTHQPSLHQRTPSKGPTAMYTASPMSTSNTTLLANSTSTLPTTATSAAAALQSQIPSNTDIERLVHAVQGINTNATSNNTANIMVARETSSRLGIRPTLNQANSNNPNGPNHAHIQPHIHAHNVLHSNSISSPSNATGSLARHSLQQPVYNPRTISR